jgi:uncharacterized metal-binding protein YceD (DUF177 family)
MSEQLPFILSFDLATLTEPVEKVLAPSPAERAAIAVWMEVAEVPALKATVRLSRLSHDLYAYDAHFTADVVQSCVATLTPVPAHHDGTFRRVYRLESRRKRARAESVERMDMEVSLMEEDGPELLDSHWLDLAAPVLEELTLALDPYPRAPGAVFEAPEEAQAERDNPFEVLKQLQQPDGPEKARKTKA